MKSFVTMQSPAVERRPTAAEPDAAAPNPTRGPGGAAAAWLNLLFILARRAPWVIRALKVPAAWLTLRFSKPVREATALNARHILGQHLSDKQCVAFGRRVVARFCEFIIDIAQATDLTRAQLVARVDSEGEAQYVRRRARRDGAIIVTAHVGPFELGLAGLTQVERDIHVVYKRDAFGEFEAARGELREHLGIREAPIDEGLGTWLQLRDALRNDGVVILQADRALPGQKSILVPFFDGHIRVPIGPEKLALATGSPIIPMFSVMTESGRCRVIIEPAIEAHEGAMLRVAESIERIVRAHPDQWLMLHPAFVAAEETAS